MPLSIKITELFFFQFLRQIGVRNEQSKTPN